MDRQQQDARSNVLLDTGPDGTRRACNNEYCLKDYGHEGECTMTIERACEILNESKWRGRDDWIDAGGNAACDVAGKAFDILHRNDAIAIAQGILAQRRVVELETELDSITTHYRTELAATEEGLAQVTQERDAANRRADSADRRATERLENLVSQLAALRKAVEPFKEVAKRLDGMKPETEWPYPSSLKVKHWRALLATEQKETHD